MERLSDLISRSAVLKQLEDWKKNWENTEDSYEKTWTLTCIDFYIRLITNQPTAYDVEKVVEEIEKESVSIWDDDLETNIRVVDKRVAMQAIRKGGVE